MSQVKSGWRPPGQGLSGPGGFKRYVISSEEWRLLWKHYFLNTEPQLIEDILWRTVRLPPGLGIVLLERLTSLTHADAPRGSRPTRLEVEVASNVMFISMAEARLHINRLEDPGTPEHYGPYAEPGPAVGEILYCALRMLGYHYVQIYSMDSTLRMAKILQAHVRDDRIVAMPPRARKLHSGDDPF